jgi:protein-S-isoprenylcysteine O-methyltransferase Ste14
MADTSVSGKQGPAELFKALAGLVVWLAIMLAMMFGPAGTWDWPRGWMFVWVYLGLMLVAGVWLWLVNPEIFAARRKIQKGTKAWDRVLTVLILATFAAILPVSALDDARFHWLPQPDWVVWLGHVLFAIGFVGFAWAVSVNRNFEATVRIQTDRGHQVITTGPYSVVRHPGYAFAILMVIGMPLALGSLYGLIPSGILLVLVLVRTLGEDATLKAELPGYAEYASKVRYRWLPGVF